MLLSMGIMSIGLITFKFDPAPPADSNAADLEAVSNDALQIEASPTPSPVPSPTPTPIPNDLETVKSGDIYDLVVKYSEAKLTCDREQFEGLVTDTSYINEDDLQFKYATVRNFEDIVCYTKRGCGPIDYIVYYTYKMDIATVETKGISIDRLFITSKDGAPVIYTGYLDDDVQAKLNDICAEDDVQTLIGDTAELMSAEMEADPDFLAYMLRMYHGSELGDDGEEITDGSETDTPDSDTSEADASGEA